MYNCTGAPNPSGIRQIVDTLFSDSFNASLSYITALMALKGLALSADIIRESHLLVLRITTLPAPVKCKLIASLADIEYRCASGVNEKIQLGAFVEAKEGVLLLESE
jgi:Replication factor C C-terminal domain